MGLGQCGLVEKIEVLTQRAHDVEMTSMLPHYVASTSVQRRYDDMCLLGMDTFTS